MTRLLTATALALAALASSAQGASAQLDDDLIPPARDFVSPERFGFEFHIGPYHPEFGDPVIEDFFKDDSGNLVALELDVIGLRLEDTLYLGGGGGIGWAKFSGKAVDEMGEATSEETELEIAPLDLIGVLRIDALPRRWSIPFIFTGKLGYRWMYWTFETGGTDEADGWSLGFLWAGQIALDLDTFEPSAARRMDEEWGINHSFLFFEISGFEPNSDSLPIGDTTWSAGLGFIM
jgi:hypothetical protein